MAQLHAKEPFALSVSPVAYVPRPASERVLERLEHWVWVSDAPLILAGPSGIGKTLLLKVLEQRVADRRDALYIPYPVLEAQDLCSWILHALSEPRRSAPDTALARLAASRRHDGGLLLLIDDAVSLPRATLCALTQLRVRCEGAVRWVLATVDGTATRDESQRAGSSAEVLGLDTPMSLEETAALLFATLDRAGANPRARSLFDAETVARLHERSGGLPLRLLVEADSVLYAEAEKPSPLNLATSPELTTVTIPRPVMPPPKRRFGLRRPMAWMLSAFAAALAMLLALAALEILPGRDPLAPPRRAPPPELPDVSAFPPLAGDPQPAAPWRQTSRAALHASDPDLLHEAGNEIPRIEPVIPAPIEAPAVSAEPEWVVNSGEIQPGEWLALSMRRQGVPSEVSELIAKEVGSLFDFRHSRTGHRYRLVRGADGELVDFRYVITPSQSIRLELKDGRYVARREISGSELATQSVAERSVDP